MGQYPPEIKHIKRLPWISEAISTLIRRIPQQQQQQEPLPPLPASVISKFTFHSFFIHTLTMIRLITVLGLIGAASAIPVDNGVEGEPEIECGPTSITINFNTRNPFEGTVYFTFLF